MTEPERQLWIPDWINKSDRQRPKNPVQIAIGIDEPAVVMVMRDEDGHFWVESLTDWQEASYD